MNNDIQQENIRQSRLVFRPEFLQNSDASALFFYVRNYRRQIIQELR